MSKSLTYWAHCFASMTLSKYSCMTLEKAHSDMLRLCASLPYVNVLLAKLNASIFLCHACGESNLQKHILAAMCRAASVRY